MVGTNEMQLNEATMIEAVQLWLESKMVIPACTPRVTSVKNGNGFGYPFTVTLEERKPVNVSEFK